MENKIINFVHRLFASSLLKELEKVNTRYYCVLDAFLEEVRQHETKQTELDVAKDEIKVLKERMQVEDRDGAIAAHVINERMRSIGPFALNAQNHSLKQTNIQLIRENKRLRDLLKRLAK